MAITEPPADQLPIDPETRFEHTDISSRGVIWTGIWILAGAWACTAILYFFFAFLVNYRDHVGAAPPVRAAGKSRVPPEPRIQQSPREDLQQLRAYEDSQINSYRWIDKQKGVVGIPIEQAIQMIAAQGIPPQQAPARLKLYPPQAGTRETGFEGKVEPEPR